MKHKTDLNGHVESSLDHVTELKNGWKLRVDFIVGNDDSDKEPKPYFVDINTLKAFHKEVATFIEAFGCPQMGYQVVGTAVGHCQLEDVWIDTKDQTFDLYFAT